MHSYSSAQQSGGFVRPQAEYWQEERGRWVYMRSFLIYLTIIEISLASLAEYLLTFFCNKVCEKVCASS